jgi:regulator of protease activity HflC (stomatin/prohibitin superfamily)
MPAISETTLGFIALLVTLLVALVGWTFTYFHSLQQSQRRAQLELGRVDKRDSQGVLIVIQAGICNGDQLGTRPDVGRGMGVS